MKKVLKLKAEDGKMRLTDCANTQTMLRLIQSIPSKKVELFERTVFSLDIPNLPVLQ